MNKHNIGIFLTVITFVLLLPKQTISHTVAMTQQARQIYSIGNSLTWDTLPYLLDEHTQHHVDCGKTLQYIFDNPNQPCIGTSYLWPNALTAQTYDIVTVQPYIGTTLIQDSAIISHWMQLQPTATFVIHTGWADHTKHEEMYHADNLTNEMQHSRAYFDDLMNMLQTAYPDRQIISTNAIDLIESIYHDIEDELAPFDALGDFYRDQLHMDYETGRYLMHNLMRLTLDQPISDANFSDTPAVIKTYFNHKLCQHTYGESYKQTPIQVGNHIYCFGQFLPILEARKFEFIENQHHQQIG